MQTIVNILNSLVGFFLAVLIVVAAAAVTGYNAIRVQQSSATTFYTIDTDSLKKSDIENHNAIKSIDDNK